MVWFWCLVNMNKITWQSPSKDLTIVRDKCHYTLFQTHKMHIKSKPNVNYGLISFNNCRLWLGILLKGESMYMWGLVQFSSVAQSCPTLCHPTNRSTPGLPVHHQLPQFTQTHVHRVGDAIQPSHPLSFPSPPALNLSQHPSLFKWVSSLHQVAKVLEFQLQHHSFQWTPRTDLL